MKVEFVVSYDNMSRRAIIKQSGVDDEFVLDDANLLFEAESRDVIDPPMNNAGWLSVTRKEPTGKYVFTLEGNKPSATQVAEAA